MQRHGGDTEPHHRPDGCPVRHAVGTGIVFHRAIRIGVRSTVGDHGALRLVV